MTVNKIVSLLGLKPLVPEGGYFVETYRSGEGTGPTSLPRRYRGRRCFGTAIYYLATPDSFSAMHNVSSDEVYHFYLGDPVEMLLLLPGGGGRRVVIGPRLEKGQRPQIVIPRGAWQGVRLRPGGKYALLGTTVCPGFEYADFTLGRRKELIERYPGFRRQIIALTRE
jgi:uncharacterized protein